MYTKQRFIMKEKNCNSHEKLNCVKRPIKVFEARNSILTDISKNENIDKLRNLWITITLCTILYSVIKDLQNNEWPNFGTKLIRTTFLKLDVALIIWIFMFMSTLSVYYVFLFWIYVSKFVQKSYLNKLFLTICLMYVCGLCYFTSKAVVSYELGVGSSLAIMMEMTRALMKFYAFLRSNCAKFLNDQERKIPSFSHYLYFLFAPTLVYMDSYPRSKGDICWRFAFQYFMGLTQTVIVKSITYEHTYKQYLKEYGLKVYTFTDIITIVSLNSILGLYLFILFQLGIHCYMNGAAVLMRFSDRQFYKDWWRASTIDQYFRKWNVFIFDWLNIYIYRDIYENIWPGKKVVARLVTYALSAAFHDIILCVTFRTYLPLITIVYVFSFLLRPFINSSKLFLILIGFNISMMFTIYAIEYYAQLNCPLDSDSVLENIKPRFLYCQKYYYVFSNKNISHISVKN